MTTLPTRRALTRARRRTRRIVRALVPVAVAGTSALLVTSSFSVFTGQASSPANAWATGTVRLTNDSASAGGVQSATGAALFSGSDTVDLKPNGPVIDRCITVRSDGSLPAEVRMYGTDATETHSLLQDLDVSVDVGTATDTDGGSCSSFGTTGTIHPRGSLRAFADTVDRFSTGRSTAWSPTGSGPETRVFRIRIWPASTMTDPQQASSAAIRFVWESRST